MKQYPASGGMKHCIVKGCPHSPAPGRRTCGRHGRQRSHSSSGRRRFIRFDCRVPELTVSLDPLPPVPEFTLEVRDNGVIVGLPTNQPQMIAFLRNWLARPEHSLDLLEQLTPARLVPSPAMANAYCSAAEALVRFDLGGAA